MSTLICGSASDVINPDDRAGLKAALELKDSLGEVRVTVLSAGPAVLHEALAMGADEAVLVSESAFGKNDWS
jgi:electron transfer flavoprotein beta subunit